MKEWLNVLKNPSNKYEFVQIQMPNEIFEDLNQQDFKSWKHKAFAYSYYYLCTFIYRNALYGISLDHFTQDKISRSIISNPNLTSYITKKNGLLEKMNYIKTTKNYPISFYKDSNNIFEFSYANDIDENTKRLLPKKGNNFSIKEPVKSLNRFDEYYSGTFYDMQNTHLVTIQRFIDIITHSNLGYVGLLIYSYLSMMNDKFPMGYQISNKKLAEFIGCNERTLTRYTKELELRGFIKSERKLLGYKLLEKKYNVIDKHDKRR